MCVAPQWPSTSARPTRFLERSKRLPNSWAGTTIRKPIEEFTTEEYDRIMDVNFKGTYFMCQEVGKQMMARKEGKIINVASLATAIGLPKITVYSGSKGAVGQFTRSLAVEWAPYNIQVNALAPGFVATDINAKSWENVEFKDWVENRTPAGRVGKSEDMTGTAVFLASSGSNFVTGQVIYVDGGVMAGSYWPL
ncbi:MAG: SDR family oxidoreductase [Candidatus Latescibacteria bacterium]|nr:SDR family oxidoreductase [Candidatus Latescibacterota bacterium]